MHNTGCLGLVHWNDPEGWYGEGVVKANFPSTRKPSHRQVFEEFWNLRGNITWREK